MREYRIRAKWLDSTLTFVHSTHETVHSVSREIRSLQEVPELKYWVESRDVGVWHPSELDNFTTN